MDMRFRIGVMEGLGLAERIRPLLILVLIAGLAFAQDGNILGDRIFNLINYICGTLVALMPVVAIGLLIMAAVVYGVGQVFGAEWKQKAQSWATGMIIGMLISLVIYLASKPIIQMMYPDVDTSGYCTPPELA